jgi:hypothetical protein
MRKWEMCIMRVREKVVSNNIMMMYKKNWIKISVIKD